MPVRRVYITESNVLFESIGIIERTDYNVGFWNRKKVTKTETKSNIAFSIYPDHTWNFEREIMERDYDDMVTVVLEPSKTASAHYKILKRYLINFLDYKIEHICENHIVFTN